MVFIKKMFLIILFLVVSCSVCNAGWLDGQSRADTYGLKYWYKNPAQVQKQINKEDRPGKLVHRRTWDNGRLTMHYKKPGCFYYFLDNRLVRMFFWNRYEIKDFQKNQIKKYSRQFGIYNTTKTINKFGLKNHTWPFMRGIRFTVVCTPDPQELRRNATTKEWRDFLKQKNIKSKYNVWDTYKTFE